MKISVYVDQDAKKVMDLCNELLTFVSELNYEYAVKVESSDFLRQWFRSSPAVARTNLEANEIYLWSGRIASKIYLRYVLAHETSHIIQKDINCAIHFRHWTWLMDYEHHRNCIALLSNAIFKRAGLEKVIHVSGNEPSMAPSIDAHANFYADTDANNLLVKTGIVSVNDFIDTLISYAEDLRSKKQDFAKSSLDIMWEKFSSGTSDRKRTLASQAWALFVEIFYVLGARWAKLSPLYGHKDFDEISMQLINAQIYAAAEKFGSFASWPQIQGYWERLQDQNFDNRRVEKLLKYIAEQCVIKIRELKG